MLRASHLSQRYALEELVLRKYPAEIKELNERIAGYEQDRAKLMERWSIRSPLRALRRWS